MTDDEINTLGSVLMGKLYDLSIQKKCIIASKAGIDISDVPTVERNPPVNRALSVAFAKLDTARRLNALPILAEQIMAVNSGMESEELTRLLEQHGYQYLDGRFVPVGLLDEREARHLPETAKSELAKAISRLTDNDESGAITAACGAVDATTTALYEKHGLGDPSGSFQAKVNTAINRLGVITKLERELAEIGVKPDDARKIAEEVHEATKHAAEALQMIRRTSGDVHGTKPTYTRIAYDSIKWASAICGLLEGE
jgi:hypothetical protein